MPAPRMLASKGDPEELAKLRTALRGAALRICLDYKVYRTPIQMEDAVEAALAYWWERLQKRDGSPLVEARDDNPLVAGLADVMAKKLRV